MSFASRARPGRCANLVAAVALTAGILSGPASAPTIAAERQPAGSNKIKVPTVQAAKAKRASASPPRAGTDDPLVYNGGAVENVPRAYLDFWGPGWAAPDQQPAVEYLTAFFAGVGGSPWLDSTREYCSGNLAPPRTACLGTGLKPITNPPGQLKGVWNDPVNVSYGTPASVCGLSSAEQGDCDVMQSVVRTMQHFGLAPQDGVVIVVTPSGASQPGFLNGGWCAYHGNLPVGGVLPSGGTPYAYLPFMPDAGFSCGQSTVNSGSAGFYDGFGIIGGHEYAEAITDPVPGSGWIDAGSGEIADKCAWVSLADISLGGRQFAVQSLWSNAAGACVLAPPAPVPARFELLGGLVTARPGTGATGGQLDAVVTSSGGGLWHRWSTGGAWSGWEGLGGVATSVPAVVSWGGGRLDVFVRSSDNGLWHRWSDGNSWSGWEGLGGTLTSELGVVSGGGGRLDVVVRSSDNALWHRWRDSGGWSGWEGLGGIATSDPALASWGGGRLDLVVRSSDNGLWHRWSDGNGWSGWEGLGGLATSNPALASWGGGRLDLAVSSNDGGLWHRGSQGGSWGNWESLGGMVKGDPGLASRGAGQLDAVVRSSDNTYWRRALSSSGWSGWLQVGGQWASSSALVHQPGVGSLDVFGQGADDNLWHVVV